MEGQITLTEWMQWREDVRRKLQETASNFVYIGYRLKQIRDSGMYDGCADIFEFAQKEYGLGKSVVSRFIAINEKFSEGGNSLEIREEYKTLGSSKLSEMLTLSEEDCRLITSKTTVKEIREIKHFNNQEPELEEKEEVQYTPLQKCIIDFFKDKKETLNEVMYLLDDGWQVEQAAKVINPGDYITYKKGIVFLFMYDYRHGVVYKIMGQAAPVKITWGDFLDEVSKVFEKCYDEDGINSIWSKFYPQQTPVKTEPKMPEKPENTPVATSQQNPEKQEELPPEVAVEIPEEEEKILPTGSDLLPVDHIAEEGKMIPDNEFVNHDNLPPVDHNVDVNGMVPEEHIPDVGKMQEEQVADNAIEGTVDESTVAAEPVKLAEEDTEEFKPPKKSNSEYRYQVRRCLSNLQAEIGADAWKAALATVKSLEHYLNLVIQEECGEEQED